MQLSAHSADECMSDSHGPPGHVQIAGLLKVTARQIVSQALPCVFTEAQGCTGTDDQLVSNTTMWQLAFKPLLIEAKDHRS